MDELRTERLLLRRPTGSDLAAFAVVGEAAARELGEALEHWRRHGFGHRVIEDHGRPVGVLELHHAGEGITGIAPDEIEVGWIVAEPARGRGVATEAARAVAADALGRLRAQWLVAYIRPANTASLRVADRLGMRHQADGLTRSGEPMRIHRLRPERTV